MQLGLRQHSATRKRATHRAHWGDDGGLGGCASGASDGPRRDRAGQRVGHGQEPQRHPIAPDPRQPTGSVDASSVLDLPRSLALYEVAHVLQLLPRMTDPADKFTYDAKRFAATE